ncbi:MAG: hypothetical protein OXL96_12460 [Candidatus Poribacteria bacterium]|nr:hypothetical protein [Candidatus Poribacteria bacterium]
MMNDATREGVEQTGGENAYIDSVVRQEGRKWKEGRDQEGQRCGDDQKATGQENTGQAETEEEMIGGLELGFRCDGHAEAVAWFNRLGHGIAGQIPDQIVEEFLAEIIPELQNHAIKFSPFNLVITDRAVYTTDLIIDRREVCRVIAVAADKIGIRFHVDDLLIGKDWDKVREG